jgi:type I restriction enzyme S subunit
MSKYKLGEIAEIQSGPFGTQLHKDEYVEFGIPMLNSKNIGNGDILVDSLDFVPQTVCERLPRYVLEEGDILFGRAGTIERHAYVTKKYDGAFQGTNCIRIRCKDKNKALYIFYYLWKNELKQKIENMAGGSIQSYITTDLLKDIEVEIPGDYERIASFLAIIDKKIENNSVINANLAA